MAVEEEEEVEKEEDCKPAWYNNCGKTKKGKKDKKDKKNKKDKKDKKNKRKLRTSALNR